MKTHDTRWTRRGALALVGSLALLASACSSSTTGAAGGGVTKPTDSLAVKDLAASFVGDVGTPPTVPAAPKPGVNLWVVSCGQAIPACSEPSAAAKEAATLVGWKVNVCDGQLNPDGWATCVRQAISAKADVILPIGLDCASVQQPFQEAKDAGVMVVGAGGSDCDATGGQALWATERLELPGGTLKDWWEGAGKIAADYLIGSTNAQAKVLQLNFTDPVWGPWLSEGFTNEIKTCSGCTIVDTLDVSNNDFASGAGVTKFAAAIQKNPDANAIYVPVGGWMPAGFAQAVVASGRQSKLVVASDFGNEANMGLVSADGGQNAVLGYSTAWGAWGSVDTAIRVLDGMKPVAEGDGYQMVDATHNLPSAGQDYTGNVDYKAAYMKLWGLS